MRAAHQLRCFPIRRDELADELQPETPQQFHRLLCDGIRSAKRRVQLATLYIGTGGTDGGNGNSGNGDDKVGGSDTGSSSSSTSSLRNTMTEEQELLDAIRSACVDATGNDEGSNPDKKKVQILMDQSRGLRPVKVKGKNKKNGATTTTTTSSAQACWEAMTTTDDDDSNSNNNSNAQLYLLPIVTHPLLNSVLRSPVNEIVGVFHVKLYLWDDHLVISGANLSREYFTTRIDRYLHIRQQQQQQQQPPSRLQSTPTSDNSGCSGGGEEEPPENIVELYSQLIDALCEYAAEPYTGNPAESISSSDNRAIGRSRQRRKEKKQLLHDKLLHLFTTTADDSAAIEDSCLTGVERAYREQGTSSSSSPTPIVAYAVPTFHAPWHYFVADSITDAAAATLTRRWRSSTLLRQDTAVWRSLFREADAIHREQQQLLLLGKSGGQNGAPRAAISTKIASAYLNPTPCFLRRKSPRHWRLESAGGDIVTTTFLTAARESHGFYSKRTTKKKNMKDYIPILYEYAAQRISKDGTRSSNNNHRYGNPRHEVVYYRRPDWTFHAKGLWMGLRQYYHPQQQSQRTDNVDSDVDEEVLLWTFGSGNFGYRSAYHDMETHLLMFLPPGSPLAAKADEEWNNVLCSDAYASDVPVVPEQRTVDRFFDAAATAGSISRPWWIKAVYPLVKSFF